MDTEAWRLWLNEDYLREILTLDHSGEIVWKPRTLETYCPPTLNRSALRIRIELNQDVVDAFNARYAYQPAIGGSTGNDGKRNRNSIKIWGLWVPREDIFRAIF